MHYIFTSLENHCINVTTAQSLVIKWFKRVDFFCLGILHIRRITNNHIEAAIAVDDVIELGEPMEGLVRSLPFIVVHA